MVIITSANVCLRNIYGNSQDYLTFFTIVNIAQNLTIKVHREHCVEKN